MLCCYFGLNPACIFTYVLIFVSRRGFSDVSADSSLISSVCYTSRFMMRDVQFVGVWVHIYSQNSCAFLFGIATSSQMLTIVSYLYLHLLFFLSQLVILMLLHDSFSLLFLYVFTLNFSVTEENVSHTFYSRSSFPRVPTSTAVFLQYIPVLVFASSSFPASVLLFGFSLTHLFVQLSYFYTSNAATTPMFQCWPIDGVK